MGTVAGPRIGDITESNKESTSALGAFEVFEKSP